MLNHFIIVPGTSRSQKRGSDNLELETQMLVRQNGDAGNQTARAAGAPDQSISPAPTGLTIFNPRLLLPIMSHRSMQASYCHS